MTRKFLGRLVFGLVLAQVGFSILAQPILGTDEIFPLFNWRIYRREPITRDHRIVLLIRRLDQQVVDPPKRIDEMKTEFPSVDSFRLESIAERVEFRSDQKCEGLAVAEIEKVLSPVGFRIVEWEVSEYEYDVLEFYLRRETLARTLKCTHASNF